MYMMSTLAWRWLGVEANPPTKDIFLLTCLNLPLICVSFRPMEWTEKHDIYLCREIIVVEPFQLKKGTVDRGKLWTKIAEALNSCKEIKLAQNSFQHFPRRRL